MARAAAVVVGFVILVSVTSCSASSTSTPPGTGAPSPGPAPVSAAGTTPVRAARPTGTGVVVGADPRSTKIVDIVTAAIPELELRSVVFGVWAGDEQIAVGAMDAPSAQPPTAIDARFRVGQPMEAMLGTVLLQLAAEGKVGLDAPVKDMVPGLVNADRITPRMLANSTGGTPDYVTEPTFAPRVAADPFAGYTFDELLGYAQKRPPLFEPGTNWAYSHTEMAALVQVLEKASGQSLEALMADRIYEPLGMTASSAHQNNAIDQPLFHAFTNQRGVYEDSTFWDPTWGFDGGMNASVDDLGMWLRALDSGQLLSPADAQVSLAPATAGLGKMTAERYFAFGSLVSGGWILGNPSLNGYMGFTAQHRDPSVTIVVWSTAGPASKEDANASQTISQRIAAVVSPEPIDL